MTESILASLKVEPLPRHTDQSSLPTLLDQPAAAPDPASPTHSTSRSSTSSATSDHIHSASASSSTASTLSQSQSHFQALHSTTQRGALSPTSVSSRSSSSPSGSSRLSPTSSSASYSSGSSDKSGMGGVLNGRSCSGKEELIEEGPRHYGGGVVAGGGSANTRGQLTSDIAALQHCQQQ